MRIEWVPAPDVEVTITAPVVKRCPFFDEVDEGVAVLTYRTHGQAMELHSLAAYLATFRDTPMSHEAWTVEVARVTRAHVTTAWTTAGMEVTCAVLRQPHNSASGA